MYCKLIKLHRKILFDFTKGFITHHERMLQTATNQQSAHETENKIKSN